MELSFFFLFGSESALLLIKLYCMCRDEIFRFEFSSFYYFIFFNSFYFANQSIIICSFHEPIHFCCLCLNITRHKRKYFLFQRKKWEALNTIKSKIYILKILFASPQNFGEKIKQVKFLMEKYLVWDSYNFLFPCILIKVIFCKQPY